MSLIITEINESEYKKSDSIELFEINERLQYNRFVAITAFQKKYKISWESEKVFLDLREISQYIYLLGVDQKFIIYDFFNSTVKLEMTLDSYYVQSLLYKDYLIIITELDLFFISKQSFRVESRIALKDIFTKIDVKEEELCIHCIGDSELHIQVRDNQIVEF